MTIRATVVTSRGYGPSPRRLCTLTSRDLCTRVSDQIAGGSVGRSYRFGLRLGLDLVVALVVLCVLFVAREPGAEAGAIAGDGEGVAVGFGVDVAAGLSNENELRILHPKNGEHLSGKTHIKLKVGQNIKNVAISIDGRYLASGPPYSIFWNSATVSNGPHQITIAAVTPALVSDAPVRVSPRKSRKFFVHNSSTPTPTPDPTATPTPASTPSPNPTPTFTPRPTATPTPTPAPTPSPDPTPAPTPRPTASPTPSPAATPTPPSPTPTPAATPSPKPSPTPTPISVSSLTLVNADTFQPISQYNPIANGATINRATLPTQNLTIQANTSPATLGSVAFDLVESGYLNTANTAPYDLCGTAPCSNLGVGLHSLNTTPYMGPNASGGAGKAMSISFSVIDPTPTPVSTPSPTPTPSSWPAGVPTPQAIPTLTPPVNPITVGPGTYGVVGNGRRNSSTGVASGTDDTNAFQTLITNGDIIVQTGTYLINGNITIPTGRNIQCQTGATFLAGVDGNSTRTFSLGYFADNEGHVSVSGCTFEGTNLPAGTNGNANSRGGASGYNQLFVISTGHGWHPGSQGPILIYNNTFKDGQGDELIPISFCGPGNGGSNTSSADCNVVNGYGTEGPSNIVIYNNTFSHAGQFCLHINGGQNIHVSHNTFIDCDVHGEEDSILQVMNGIMVDHNLFTTSSAYGWYYVQYNTLYGLDMTATGDIGYASNGHGFWFIDNQIDGTSSLATYNQASTLFTGCPNQHVTGVATGNYYGNYFTNGASSVGTAYEGTSCGTSTQQTTPYCNGGTCTTTGWLNNPPTQ